MPRCRITTDSHVTSIATCGNFRSKTVRWTTSWAQRGKVLWLVAVLGMSRVGLAIPQLASPDFESNLSKTSNRTEERSAESPESNYNPLRLLSKATTTLDLVVEDAKRSRSIPLLIYSPTGKGAAPVILHSHGLGGTKETSSFLGEHWAARGYIAVFLQHPGSDDSVWKDTPPLRRMARLRDAANNENLILRVQDVTATIDQLEQWNKMENHPLAHRMELDHIGVSGHSFGAVTTQRVAGQTTRGTARYADPRVRAAIPMSPSLPRASITANPFAEVKLPWLCMTGSRDKSPIGSISPSSRREVFKALPPGDKYELVLDGAEHSAFTEREFRPTPVERNPNHHRAIMAVSTAFWDAYLREDPAAKAWLQSDDIRKVLEPEDQWQTK